MVDEVERSSRQMLNGSNLVSEEMRRLGTLSDTIAASMKDMAKEANQINIAVCEVNDISKENKRSSEYLAHEVSKFKA